MRAVGVIPARHASTRFPGKPLALLSGRPMIQWVHEAVARAKTLDRVLVATDDERIAARVASFGAEAVLTSPHHPTGTDRVAEAVADSEADIVVNVQGDEPLMDPAGIDAAVEALRSDPEAAMSTLACPLEDVDEFHDPNVVKLVTDAEGRALWFSRAPVPWPRDGGLRPEPVGARKHVGLYAYRREFLLRFCGWSPGRHEQVESLEQLRALDRGARIRVVDGPRASLAVDRPEDVAAVEALLLERAAAEERD